MCLICKINETKLCFLIHLPNILRNYFKFTIGITWKYTQQTILSLHCGGIIDLSISENLFRNTEIDSTENYFKSFTLTAVSPFFPFSVSKVTVLFSLMGSIKLLACTKILCCVAASFIKPYPLESL